MSMCATSAHLSKVIAGLRGAGGIKGVERATALMILGLGSDICDIRRIEKAIERYGDRFLERVFTETERAKAMRRTEKIRAATFAKRFAAKEAASKALGTGFRQGRVFLRSRRGEFAGWPADAADDRRRGASVCGRSRRRGWWRRWR